MQECPGFEELGQIKMINQHTKLVPGMPVSALPNLRRHPN